MIPLLGGMLWGLVVSASVFALLFLGTKAFRFIWPKPPFSLKKKASPKKVSPYRLGAQITASAPLLEVIKPAAEPPKPKLPSKCLTAEEAGAKLHRKAQELDVEKFFKKKIEPEIIAAIGRERSEVTIHSLSALTIGQVSSFVKGLGYDISRGSYSNSPDGHLTIRFPVKRKKS